jgi:hypothetical protein
MGMEFLREACKRLPLADALLRLGQFVLNDDHLDEIFKRHSGQSREKVITFRDFVSLIGDALLVNHGSGNQAFQRAIEDETLKASVQAAYGKLRRTPISLSTGFLAMTTQRLLEVFPENVPSHLPKCLNDFEVLNVDGKKLKHIPHRLLPTRKLRGALFGGKVLVAYCQRTGLTRAMAAVLDGETSDAPLVPSLLEQLRAAGTPPRLFVEDRAFCDLMQPNLLQDNEYFLIRYHCKVSFHHDYQQRVRRGRDAEDRKYKEEWGWLGKANDPRRVRVRRITVYRPGKESVIVVTNLLDADKFPAADLLEVYRHRWDIEQLFQRTTDVYGLRELIGSSPQATIFQAAYCFLLSNLTMTLRAYAAQSQGMKPQEVSCYQVHYDLRQELIAWTKLLDKETTEELFGGPLTPSRLRSHLKRCVSRAWSDRWRKAPSTRHTPVEDKTYIRGGHTSVQRLLLKAKDKDKAKNNRRKKHV